jgi:hypothetical protein
MRAFLDAQLARRRHAPKRAIAIVRQYGDQFREAHPDNHADQLRPAPLDNPRRCCQLPERAENETGPSALSLSVRELATPPHRKETEARHTAARSTARGEF